MRTPKKRVGANGRTSWTVRYRSRDGRERSETFYDEGMAEEFSKILDTVKDPDRALRLLDNYTERANAGHDLTVGELWAKWRAWKGRTNLRGELLEVRSARTLMDYDRLWRKRIEPRFGRVPVDLVTQTDVQDWVDNLGTELEPKTVADHHALLHGLFAWGMHPTRGLTSHDPCSETRLPKRRKKAPKGLFPEEWALLHQAAVAVNPDAADLLLFMVSTGWRWSECVAVQAMAVDVAPDPTSASGWQTWVTMGRVLRREGNHFAFVEDAKSAAGERRIRVVGPGEAMLHRRLVGKAPEDLIFTGPRGGQWRYEHFFRRIWARPKTGDDAPGKPRILEEAAKLGLARTDISPHWLRHTHVAMLIRAGEPLPAIQKRLGHADIRTTANVYGRMIDDASAAGLDKVAALIAGAVGSNSGSIEAAASGGSNPKGQALETRQGHGEPVTSQIED